MHAIVSFHYLYTVVLDGWTPPPDTVYILNHILFQGQDPWYGEHFLFPERLQTPEGQETLEKVRALLEQAQKEGRLYRASQELYGVRLYASVLKKHGLNLSRSDATDWAWLRHCVNMMTDAGWTVFDSLTRHMYCSQEELDKYHTRCPAAVLNV